MWRRIIVLTIIWFSLALPAFGQSVPDDSLLESLVGKALDQNPDIQAALERARSADLMVSPAGALPDPMAMVGLSGPLAESWVGEPMAMPNVAIGLSQKFPFPGKQGSMKGAARSKAEGILQSAEYARQMMASEVRSAYYDLAYWRAALETVEKNLSFIDELEAVARERYKVGLGLQVHVLQAQKTRTKIEDRRLAVMQMIETSQQRLLALVNDFSAGETVAKLPTVESLPRIESDTLKQRMLTRNPVYLKSDFDIEANRMMLRKAKLDYLPDLTLGATYGFRWENRMFPMFSKDMLSVSAGLNIPLWAGWKQKNMVSSAAASLRGAEYRKTDMRNKLIFELEKNLLEYDRNSSKFTLYEESLVPQTRATLESARAAYQVGKLEFLDVITAQMELFDAELELQRSLAEALKALAAIDRLTADAAPLLADNK